MPQTGERIGGYVIEERLGAGGFGEVWRARCEGRTVAIKFPSDAAGVEAIGREARILRDLAHEHIVRTLEVRPSADPPYIVMEHVPGGNLRGTLARRGRLPVDEAAEIVLQILSALEYAHERGVLHLDLKPENVLVSEGRRAKVSDFGLGRTVSRSDTSLYLSGPNEPQGPAGTLDYMAPEQRRGQDVDNRADVYAAGLILYELLVGELPVGAFRFPSEIDPSLPASVDDVLRRALAPHPTDRIATAAEMAEALRRAVDAAGREYEPPREGIAYRRREPFVFHSGHEAFTVRELAEYAASNPDVAILHFAGGDFEPWLRAAGDLALARRAEEIRTAEADREIGLQRFLEATGFVPGPRLEVDAREIDLGAFPRGERKTIRIHARRFGRGIVWGQAAAPEPLSPPARYFKGVEAVMEFLLETADLEPGRAYETNIVVTWNAGTLRIPVRFEVRPRPGYLVVPLREVELVTRGRKAVRTTLRIINAGDLPLSLSAMCAEEWVELGPVRDLAPHEQAKLEVTVRPSAIPAEQLREEEGARRASARVMLASPDGGCDVPLRVSMVPRFDLAGFLLGLLTGAIPFIAELVFAVMFLALAGTLLWPDRSRTAGGRKSAYAELRDNTSFLLGMLPGVIAHLILFLGSR